MHADHNAVAHRVVVGGDPRVVLCVVADVQQHLARVTRDGHPVEHCAGAGALFVHGNRALGRAIRVAHGIRSTLGDRR